MYRDEEKEFDIRVLEKHFPSDDASCKKIRAYIDNLPDASSNIDTDYQFDFSFLASAATDEPNEVADDENEALTEDAPVEANS